MGAASFWGLWGDIILIPLKILPTADLGVKGIMGKISELGAVDDLFSHAGQ